MKMKENTGKILEHTFINSREHLCWFLYLWQNVLSPHVHLGSVHGGLNSQDSTPTNF